MNIRTGEAVRGPLRRIIRTVGTVEYAETGQAEVSTKFKGWIEKLHVDATGQQVHRDEPLFEIYSPARYNAPGESLLARKSTGDAVRTSAPPKTKFDGSGPFFPRARRPTNAAVGRNPQD